MVGIMGSGTDAHAEWAEPLARWLAERGFHLLTGGGQGVMARASRAFSQTPGRAGLVIGILPGEATERGYAARPGYPNPWVELPVYTHLPLSGTQGTHPDSRNHINVLTADVLVALPGGDGTRCETKLALRYRKPLLLFGPHAAFARFPAVLPRTEELAAACRFIEAALEGALVARPDGSFSLSGESDG